MSANVSRLPEGSSVRVKHEEESPLQVKGESGGKRTLHLISAKKRKRVDPEKGNELFLGSSASREAQSASSVSEVEQNHTNHKRQDTGGEFKSAWAPIRKKAWSKRPAGNVVKTVVNTRGTEDLYKNLDINRLQKIDRTNLLTLRDMKRLVHECIDTHKAAGDVEEKFTALREKIHKMEFYPWLNGKLIKDSKVLEPGSLERVFNNPDQNIFSWDIKADAEALWLRWKGGDIDFDLLRGIRSTKDLDKKTGRKSTSYKMEDVSSKRSAQCVGNNDIINGQWWPSRLAAFRDGAHGEIEAGICGKAGEGAYSIVIANGGYNDKDDGESVEYCGTRGEPNKPSKHTNFLLESRTKRQPLRVLRAVHKESNYAPREGIRYDGLYEITDFEVVEHETAMYRFSLRRLPGQDPIRYQGVEVRPTPQELAERMKIRKLLS